VLNEHGERVSALFFGITGAGFTAIGAFSEATLGYFDWDRKDYERIPVSVQGENEKKVHAHVVLGTRDGSARGGHLLAATVRPTLEVIVEESRSALRRRIDDVDRGRVLERDGEVRLPLARAELVEHPVLRDLEEPRREEATQREARQPLEDAQEDVLRQVLRQSAVADGAQHVVVDRHLVHPHDHGVRALVPSLRLAQQC